MQELPLYNSRIISTFIEYLKNAAPEINISELLNDSGITSFEVEDEGHWLTQRQVDAFHDALMGKTNNFSLFREAGRYMVASRSITAVRQFVMGFVTPIHAYTMLEKVASYLNRAAVYKANKLSSNQVEIISTPVEGVEEKQYQCENRKGAFEAVAKLFTNKLPVLEHPVCMHQGGDHCRYIISWEEAPFLKWKRLRNYGALMATIIILTGAFYLPPFNLALFALVCMAVVSGISLYSYKIERKDIYAKIEMQGNAANRLLDQITIHYDNTLLIQEIGQGVSNILNIDELLKFVMDTLQKRLDFDRGMIMLANAERTRLVYVSGYGYNPIHEELLKRTHFHLDNPKSKGHFVQAFREQKPFLIANIKDFREDLSTRSYEFAEAMGVQSFICVPIVYEGQSEGILAVDNPRSKRPLGQSEVSLLMGIAPQIAISINNARSLQQIRESEERFRLLGENSPDIIYTLGTDGAFTYVNPAWENILGYGREDVLGRYFTDFVKKEDTEQYRQLFSGIRKRKETVRNFQGTLLARDGMERLFFISAAPNFNARGETTGIVGTFKDVTKERHLETQLQQASKMEALGRLTGGISHDFNNIVQAISGYNQLLMLKKDESDPDWKYLVNINQLTWRAADIIKQLMLFSRKAESRMAPRNLNEEIRKFCELMASTLPKTIEVKLDLADDIHIIDGDSSQLGQVIMNLMVNARDAMPEGGKITIHTENVEFKVRQHREKVQMKAGRYVLLRISDTGCGMNEETRSHIFEPFFTTKDTGKGTGIGLAVVYGIAKNHKGYIFCSSEEGQGTSIDVYLPASELPVLEEQSPATPQRHISGKQETILLVDDEQQLLEIGKDLLDYYGYRVLTAASGEDALAIITLERRDISLIILDLMMPGMGGEKCLEEIKKIAPFMKVVIASGFVANDKRRDIIKSGALAFIQKPYQFDDLNKTIRDVLDHSPVGRRPLQIIKGV